MTDIKGKIWADNGMLRPIQFVSAPVKDIAFVIVNRDRRDLTDYLCEQILTFNNDDSLTFDLYVVDIGSQPEGRSPFTTIEYEDTNFRGKCYAHNVGVRQAALSANYRYYWVMMNDLRFDNQPDAMARMVRLMDGHPELGILSPTNIGEGKEFPGSTPQTGQEFRKVAVCEYLSLMFRAEVILEVGFLNPDFRYSWGAIHELSYKIYSAGKWALAYCDTVQFTHLGGTTYGKSKNVVSRDEYKDRAMKFAVHYFLEHYGRDWDEKFTAILPSDVTQRHLYIFHREAFEKAFKPEEINFMRPVKADEGIESRIAALNPWYYPLTIADHDVVPGIGSRETTEALIGRFNYMGKLWLDEVRLRYDFRGKSLLDIASNCGYWSSQYVAFGATRFLGVEGRLDTVRQGQLYWKENHILPAGNWEFIHGNVCSTETWAQIRQKGPFDFTLCCGILYHIPDYENLLAFLRTVTKDAMLVDTRVEEEENFVQEPGGWRFDGIAETSFKKVPTLKNLVSVLETLGFKLEELTIPDTVPFGLQGMDDYSQKRRVTFLAKL